MKDNVENVMQPAVVESPATPESIIDIYGAKVLLDEKQAIDLSPFLNIANTRVNKGDVYDQSLYQLVAQVSILSQILGSVDVLKSALEGSDRQPSPEDEGVYANLQHAVDTTVAVLREKIAILEQAAVAAENKPKRSGKRKAK